MSEIREIDVAEECTCMFILNYLSLVGVCNSNGGYSPMVFDGDCLEGEAVCYSEDGEVNNMGEAVYFSR